MSRAREQPSWRYFDRVVEQTAGSSTLLELQAGIGTMVGNLASPPALYPIEVWWAEIARVLQPRS